MLSLVAGDARQSAQPVLAERIESMD